MLKSIKNATVLGLLFLGACTTTNTPSPQAITSPPVMAVKPLPPKPVGTMKVGLLLPLTGSQSALGESLLHSAQQGVLSQGTATLVLYPQDTGGTPEGARLAARRALDQGCQIILGPIFGGEARAVGPIAAARNVPVISFSNDQTVAGGNVFLLGFQPQDQVLRMVQYAKDNNLEPLGALVPNTPYGTMVKDVLHPVTPYVWTYDPRMQDLSASINTLKAVNLKALLLPEGGDKLIPLVQALNAQGVDWRAMKPLGLANWDQGAGNLPGALFAAPAIDGRQSFEASFAGTYGYQAHRLSTLAYDAIALVIASGGAYEKLLDPKGFIGIEGPFRFTPQRVAQRKLAILEATSQGLKTIDPAPREF